MKRRNRSSENPEPPSGRAAAAQRVGVVRFALATFVCATVVLSLHAWYYHRFMVDDAFISLRYSDRLIHGLGLTWNDGEVVEGYSNLLWVLGCALLGRLGLDLIVAARVLGSLGTAAAIGALIWVHRGHTARQALPGFTAALALSLSGSVAIWTVGGLEQPLLAALLAWALALSFPLLEESEPRITRLLGVGFLLGLIVITRSDGAVFTLALCLGIVASRGLGPKAVRVALMLALLPLLFFIGQLAFRLAYYHEWLPNSAYAKVSFTPSRMWTGIGYVCGAIYLAGLLVPSFMAFRLARKSSLRKRACFLGIVLAVWFGYLVVVGGDFFPGRRHLFPAVVVLAYLSAISFTILIPRQGSLRPVLWGGTFCLVTLIVFQFLDPKNALARNERWVWDGECIGDLLAEAFGAERPLLAVDPAGCVPYFSHLPSVDMLGINDHYLAHHRPGNFGKGVLGHELGNGPYVLSRRPDLVLFNLPTGNLRPYFRSGREMVFDASSNFLATFRPVTFECERPRHLLSIVWARTEGGAIGIRRSADRIQIPGYLFSAKQFSRARLDAEGRIGAGVLPDTPAGFSGLSVPPGRWAVRVEGSGGEVFLHVWRTSTGDSLAAGASGLTFLVTESRPESVTIAMETHQTYGAHVSEVTLDRLGSAPAR